MAEVTREEFDALKARVDRLDGTSAPSLVLTAVVGTGYVDLAWSIANKTKDPIKFWVGRNGVDADGSGPWETEEANNMRSRRFDKLLPGNKYVFHVEAEFANGEMLGETVEAVPLAVPPPPVTPIPPKPGDNYVYTTGRRSGLKVNVVSFNGGDSGLDYMNNNPTGVKLDGMLTFSNRWSGGWGPVKNGNTIYGGHDDALIAEIIRVQKAGGIAIISMPHAPESEGAAMNQRGADNKYKEAQIAVASYWKMKGVIPEQLIIRLGWEFNGKWYAWSVQNGGAAVLTKALDNFKTNWKSRMPGTLFDLCSNMPSTGSTASWKDLWGSGWDIISIDQYDAYPAVKNASDWESKMADIHSVRGARTESARLGCMWAIAECGNWHTDSGGYDNPYYWVAMAAEINKGISNIAYFDLYDDAGAPVLYHDWAHNPKSLTTVKGILSTWKK